ncbi:TTL-domain-containing protein [Rhizoclosmatium globosum]|uniref:TTL-domain-containing protein n=1 Tax=Rhizoclosmatium globosum TaxID=329046 RepID=A0A1Y2BVI6_9FUNG|nr:TTL-domain-containing protein [Rhizoclosmatium globosum]|eukprot:ORY38770.1 TTL-domain-containing protein [Rhizoclosmatium globosum]
MASVAPLNEPPEQTSLKYTLPTRPSRLVRVPSPPAPLLADTTSTSTSTSHTTQPVYHPYPHSTKRSNSASTTREPRPQFKTDDSSATLILDAEPMNNTLNRKPIITLQKQQTKSVVNMSPSPLTTPASSHRPPLQPSKVKHSSKSVRNKTLEQSTSTHKPSLVKASGLQKQDSKILLTGRRVGGGGQGASGTATVKKEPRKVIGSLIGDLEDARDVNTRASSIITLQEAEPEEEAVDTDSDVNDEAEEEEDESDMENDDEEEQEISDFDSNGEYDDDDEEEEEEDLDSERGKGHTRPTTNSAGETDGANVRYWDRSTRGSKRGGMITDGKLKRAESAQRYGIAVMIDDTVDMSSRMGTTNEMLSSGISGAKFMDDSKGLFKVKPAIVPSLFDDGEAVLYFPKEGEAVTTIPSELKDAMKWKICKFTPRVVRTCLRRAGFKLVRGGKKWIGYWGKHYPAEKFKSVQPWQKVNHFPMSFEIGRKDKMYLNVSRMRERVKDDTMGLDFLPATYFLPSQRRRLKLAFNSHPTWIIKPPASARGIGIRVVNKWKDVPQRKEIIVSKYVQNPYLIDKKKFDIRLYVVVTSFDPLRIYLYKEGIVRFAGETYSTNSSRHSIRNRFIHLTNYSVSRKKKKVDPNATKTTPTYPFGDPLFSTETSKWSLATLEEYFSRQGIDFNPIMEKIRHVVVSTVISGHASNSSGTRMYTTSVNCCYELFGFDVLLDANLKPWVMEVNISPSLKASCDMDLGVKSRLSVDLFNLVGIRVRDLDESQKKRKKSPIQKPFLSISERQKMRYFALNQDANILSDLTDYDLRVLKESEDENRRRGGFDRIFPSVVPSRAFADTSSYFKLFTSPPYSDNLLLQWVKLAAQDRTRAFNLLRRVPYGNGNYNPNTSSSEITPSRRASSARTPPTSRGSIASLSAQSKERQSVSTHKPVAVPSGTKLVKKSVAIQPTHDVRAPSQLIPKQDEQNINEYNSVYSTISHHPASTQTEIHAQNPFSVFPERQLMQIRKADMSTAGIMPHFNSNYILKPKKISLRQKQRGYESSGMIQPEMTETMANTIAQEMYQLQLQQQLHQYHQQKYYEQQQQIRIQQRATSAGSLAHTMAKEYPSTSAYTAAMAIAHVTARFRAMETGTNSDSHSSNIRQQGISQQELMTWAALMQRQQQAENIRYAFMEPQAKHSNRVSSAMRRRKINTPTE